MGQPMWALVAIQIYGVCAGGIGDNAPDVSLATVPVAYYGANWNRTQENIDVLARMQMIVLMQEDGPCWAKCCPKRFDGFGQCGWKPDDPPATARAGCDSA